MRHIFYEILLKLQAYRVPFINITHIESFKQIHFLFMILLYVNERKSSNKNMAQLCTKPNETKPFILFEQTLFL